MGISKRGMSTVIATVMLILLTLIAIFLLWFFLRPTIVGTDEKLGTTADCIKVRVEPVNCEYYNSSICEGVLLAATVRRAAGTGDYSGFEFIFEKKDGTQLFLNNSAFGIIPRGLLPLEETQYKVFGKFFGTKADTLLNGSLFANMNVAVLVGKDSRSCNPLGSEINCAEKKRVGVDACTDYNGDDKFDLFDFYKFINEWNAAKNEWFGLIKDCENNFEGEERQRCIDGAIITALQDHPLADFNGDLTFDVGDFGGFCATLDSQSKDGTHCSPY
jgi:hypothetical protein